MKCPECGFDAVEVMGKLMEIIAELKKTMKEIEGLR